MGRASGDFRGLEQLRRMFDGLARDGATELLKVLAAEAVTQVELGFEQGRDPYGRPWKPVRRKGRPLRKTGRLMNSYTSKVYGRGFVLGTNTPYARYHQDGTKYIARRRMVPERDLGRIWRTAFRAAAADFRKRRVGR